MYAAPNHAGFVFQNTGQIILPNTTYSMSVDFADIGFPDYRGDQAIRFFRGDPANGGTMFAEAIVSQTDIPRIQNPNADQVNAPGYPIVGKWVTKTLSYVTGTNGTEIGGTLWIALANLPTSPHRYEFVGEDNVRVSYACNIPISNPSFEQDQFVNPPAGWAKKTLEAPGTGIYSAFGENRYLIATNGTRFAAPNHAGLLYQSTGHTVLPNTTYSFTVDFADIGFSDYRGDQALRLYDHNPASGGDPFAELQIEKTEIPRFSNPNTGNPVAGQWITKTLKYTTGGIDAPGVGQQLWIAIANLITTTHRYEFVAEDNVRLTYSCSTH
jgi:hypothetical protein